MATNAHQAAPSAHAPGAASVLRELHTAGRAVLELTAAALRPLVNQSATYAQWARDVDDLITCHDIDRAARRRDISLLQHLTRTARTDALRAAAAIAWAMLDFIDYQLRTGPATDADEDEAAPVVNRYTEPPPRHLDPSITPRTPTAPPRSARADYCHGRITMHDTEVSM